MSKTMHPPPEASDAPAPKLSKAPAPLPEPTLVAYYSQKAPRPVSWLRAVKEAKLTAFPHAEVEAGLARLQDLDSDLRKTMALADSANLPTAVGRWVAEATRSLTRACLKEITADPALPSTEQLRQTAHALAPILHAKNIPERTAAENLLRLCLRQLVENRELDPGDALRVLSGVLRSDARSFEGIRRNLKQRMLKARVPQLRDLALTFSFVEARIIAAENERREAYLKASRLEEKLETAKDQIHDLQVALATAQQKMVALEADLESARRTAHDDRQIGAHSQAELRARFRSILVGRLDRVLTDAQDATEIDPPAIEVVRDRIRSARHIIKGEVVWLSESSG